MGSPTVSCSQLRTLGEVNPRSEAEQTVVGLVKAASASQDAPGSLHMQSGSGAAVGAGGGRGRGASGASQHPLDRFKQRDIFSVKNVRFAHRQVTKSTIIQSLSSKTTTF